MSEANGSTRRPAKARRVAVRLMPLDGIRDECLRRALMVANESLTALAARLERLERDVKKH